MKFIKWGLIGIIVIGVLGQLAKEEAGEQSAQAEPRDADATAVVAQENKPDQTPKPAEKPISNIEFYEIRNRAEGMTEVQFKEYARSLKGERIRWRGYVEEVDEKMFGGYELWVDMDSPHEPLSIQDVTFDIPKDKALGLSKDQSLVFEGTISSVQSILTSLQIGLEDAVVRD